MPARQRRPVVQGHGGLGVVEGAVAEAGWQVQPDGVGRSVVLHTAYARPGLPAEEQAKLVEMAPWICETVVDGEDFWVAARTEPGLRTGLVDTVVFGRNEPACQHLHRGFAEALRAAGVIAP